MRKLVVLGQSAGFHTGSFANSLLSKSCERVSPFSTPSPVCLVTGNRCKHIGYDEFNPDSWNSECAPDTEDWISPDTRGLCGVAKSYPEEFWACSDITISSGATKGFALR